MRIYKSEDGIFAFEILDEIHLAAVLINEVIRGFAQIINYGRSGLRTTRSQAGNKYNGKT